MKQSKFEWMSVIERYKRELLTSVIPFWESHCIDHAHGGYFTFLDRDGSVYDKDKYMWMQWRIVYQFATLYSSPYGKPEWLQIAEKGFEFLHANGHDAEGNYYFAINQSGKPIIAPYNIFSEAFVVMGAAALYKATKSEAHKQAALNAMDNYIRRIKNPKGRWEKSFPNRPKRLSLGPYMILANLGTVLKECIGIDRYDKDVGEAIDIVLNKFWNEKYQVLFENINLDDTFDLESCDGRHLNPGHGLESMWFILQHAERENRPELIPKACNIIKALLKFGWDQDHGGLYYFMDVLGKPHGELTWDMKLWWVHNEAIIATLYGYSLTGDKEFLDWFIKLDGWTWSHFPDPEYGEWFGYLNRRGEPTHKLKGGKWKTFFHLPRCLLVSIGLMKKITKNIEF